MYVLLAFNKTGVLTGETTGCVRSPKLPAANDSRRELTPPMGFELRPSGEYALLGFNNSSPYLASLQKKSFWIQRLVVIPSG